MTTPLPDINGGHRNDVALRDYIEARMNDARDALEVASQEREKAAQQLRDQQYRAMEQAEREREKAADALRESLSRSIKDGDERLREHIANQIQQINGALDSAEKLEQNRLERAHADTDSVRREMRLITDASMQAVEKAEAAQADVNAKGNEFRGQLSDQATLFYPRREAEARTEEIARRIEEARHERERQLVTVSERLTVLERGDYGRMKVEGATERQQDRAQPWAIWVAGAIITVVVVISNLLASQ